MKEGVGSTHVPIRFGREAFCGDETELAHRRKAETVSRLRKGIRLVKNHKGDADAETRLKKPEIATRKKRGGPGGE